MEISAPLAVRSTIPHSLCIAGGKGGTGKSSLTSGLAWCLARRARVLLVDGDLGAGNAHLLQDVVPAHNLVEVATGRVSVREARVSCGPGLDLLAGGSGYAGASNLTPKELARLALGVAEIEPEYDWVLVDSAAGLSRQTLALAAAAERIWMVTTPDVTSVTDAYAFLKVLLQGDARVLPEVVFNRCRSEGEAEDAMGRLAGAARRFLGVELECLGQLPEDEAARRSLRRREPVPAGEGDSPLARGMEGLAEALLSGTPVVGSWSESLLAACAVPESNR